MTRPGINNHLVVLIDFIFQPRTTPHTLTLVLSISPIHIQQPLHSLVFFSHQHFNQTTNTPLSLFTLHPPTQTNHQQCLQEVKAARPAPRPSLLPDLPRPDFNVSCLLLVYLPSSITDSSPRRSYSPSAQEGQLRSANRFRSTRLPRCRP